MWYYCLRVLYCNISMYAFIAAHLQMSVTVHATHAAVTCVLLAVFDIIRHNKAAAVQLECHIL